MIIRQLAPADVQAYKRIRLQALRENPEAFSSSWEEESAFTDQEWEERLVRIGFYRAEGFGSRANP